ncbi:MAG: DUF72 domain-containing protein [Candidatus Caldatribacterium sp.]|nr:DUF72 domain-containing protein [Candidatus Caldatribacterium sp.]
MFHVGTCSWTDRTLIEESDFYPKEVQTPAERLRFYARHFDTVEVDSTFYAFPSERNAVLWAERTPPGFLFNVKALSLFTFHRTPRKALPLFLLRTLDPARQNAEEFSTKDLPESWLAEALLAFLKTLNPLREKGKLGYVLFQFPPWFRPESESFAYLEWLRNHTEGVTVALEFRHRSWFQRGTFPRTLKFLRDLNLALVCVDEPNLPWTVPPFFETTHTVAVVRFHGRNERAWQERNLPVWEKFRYLYSKEELREWRDRILSKLPEKTEVFVMFNNCYRDFAVRNALEMKKLLGEGGAHA